MKAQKTSPKYVKEQEVQDIVSEINKSTDNLFYGLIFVGIIAFASLFTSFVK